MTASVLLVLAVLASASAEPITIAQAVDELQRGRAVIVAAAAGQERSVPSKPP